MDDHSARHMKTTVLDSIAHVLVPEEFGDKFPSAELPGIEDSFDERVF